MAAKLGKKVDEPGIDLEQLGKPETGTQGGSSTVSSTPEASSSTPAAGAEASSTPAITTPAAPTPGPTAEVTSDPGLMSCSIEISILPPGTKLEGYMASMRSASFDLPPHLCDRFRRFVAGLHRSHATYPGVGGKTMHVDTAADAMKWLISQLPQ